MYDASSCQKPRKHEEYDNANKTSGQRIECQVKRYDTDDRKRSYSIEGWDAKLLMRSRSEMPRALNEQMIIYKTLDVMAPNDTASTTVIQRRY